MKKFLSLFIALAMVLSLFAGVGAKSAKAALVVTTSPDMTAGVAFTAGTAKDIVATVASSPVLANGSWVVSILSGTVSCNVPGYDTYVNAGGVQTFTFVLGATPATTPLTKTFSVLFGAAAPAGAYAVRFDLMDGTTVVATTTGVALVNVVTPGATKPLAPTWTPGFVTTDNYRVTMTLPTLQAAGNTFNLYRGSATSTFATATLVASDIAGSTTATTAYKDYIRTPSATAQTTYNYWLTEVNAIGESDESSAAAATNVETRYFFDAVPDVRTFVPTYAMGDSVKVTFLTPANAGTTAVLYPLSLVNSAATPVSIATAAAVIPAGAAATLRDFTFVTSGALTEGTYYVTDGTNKTGELYLHYNVTGIPTSLTLNTTVAQAIYGRVTRASGASTGSFTVTMVRPDGTTLAAGSGWDGISFNIVDLFNQVGTYTFWISDSYAPDYGGTGCYRYGKLTVAAPGLTVTHVIDPEVIYAKQAGYAYLYITDALGYAVTGLVPGQFALDSGVTGFATVTNMGGGFYEVKGTPASAGTANYVIYNEAAQKNQVASFTLSFVPTGPVWNPTIQLLDASTAIGAGEKWDIKVNYNVTADYTLKDQYTSVTGPLGDGWFAPVALGGLGGTDAAGTGELTLPVQMGGQIGLTMEALVWNAKTSTGVATDAWTAKSQELKTVFKFNPAIVGDKVTVDTDTVNVGSTKDVTVTVKLPSDLERNNGKVFLSSDVAGMFTVPTGAIYGYTDYTMSEVALDAITVNRNIIGGKYVFAGLKFNHVGTITVRVVDGTGKTSAYLPDYITVDPTIHTLTASVDKVVAGQVYPSIKVTGAVTGLTFNYPAIAYSDGSYEFSFPNSFAYSSLGLKLVADDGDDEYKVVIPMEKPLITLTSVQKDDKLITDSMTEKVAFTVTDPVTGAVMSVTDVDFKEQYSSWTHTADTGVGNLAVSKINALTSEIVGDAPSIKVNATTGNPYLDVTVDKPVIRLYVTLNGVTVNYKGFLTVAPAQLTITPADLVLFYGQSNMFSVKALDAHGTAIEGAAVTGTNNYNQVPAVDVFGGITGADGVVSFMYTPNYIGEIYIESAGLNLTDLDALVLQIVPAPADTTAPVIKVAEGLDGSTVTTDVLKLTGSVSEKVTALYVGFNKVDVLPDGSFMTTVKLAAGANTIDLTAYDLAGNKGTLSVKVTYTAPKTGTVIVLTVGTDVVTVDGKATSIDAAPEIINSRTFVPIRFISETFGADVEWLAETQGITITLGDSTIGLQIGNATAVIDGNIVSLPAAPYIKNGRTMVPLRVISDAFGGDVVWDAALRTITITYVQP